MFLFSDAVVGESIIQEAGIGQEIADIYLRAGNDESSEDEEGTEVMPDEVEENEEKNFEDFVKKHKSKSNNVK